MIYLVICHTENCENKNISIEFNDPANTVICGPCGKEITDKQPLNLNLETIQE